MTDCPYTVAELLPHAPPMILIGDIVGFSDTGCTAALGITAQSRFFEPGKGVPAYVGLEYMAQTCGLFAGLRARSQNLPVRIGYLLGTRDFHSEEGWFAPGTDLRVEVTEIMHDDPMGVFDCRICSAGRTIVTARLNVYQPPEQPDESSGGEP
ncbi:MAG: hypothetical protein WCD42_00485 [Rhizomicrobium sp.]